MAGRPEPIPFSVWRKVAMATWKPRTDPAIWATVDVDAERLLEYIDEVRDATGAHVTPMHLVGRATARVFKAMPGLNGRVLLGGFKPSPTVDCFYVVSLRTDKVDASEATGTDLSGAVVRRVDEKTPWVVARELAERAKLIRTGRDPQFAQAKAIVRLLPPPAIRLLMAGVGFVTETLQLPVPLMGLEGRPYGSFMVSNVGSYGLDRAFAPAPTFCHVPVTVLVGAVTDKPVVRGGQVVAGRILPLAIGIDHRFVDGYQAAAMADIFHEYLKDPAAFDPVPSSTTAARSPPELEVRPAPDL